MGTEESGDEQRHGEDRLYPCCAKIRLVSSFYVLTKSSDFKCEIKQIRENFVKVESEPPETGNGNLVRIQ